MIDQFFESLVASANGVLDHPRRDKIIDVASGSASASPRFELYHSAPSLCSFKVRTLLFERKIPFRSHDMSIMPVGDAVPENYRPAYVRMRLRGAPNVRLVDGYSGISSVTTQGFDPCVVPTLVDHEKELVVVDSARICAHLDREWIEGQPLLPDSLAGEILAQVDLVDQAPHVAVLYGAHPDGDNRPKGLRINIKDVHAKKIAAVRSMMRQIEDDEIHVEQVEELLAAYRAKVTKESSAHEFVYDADAMRSAHEAMNKHVQTIETQLTRSNGPWVLGERYTLADIMWTNSLYRLKWLGLGHLWEGTRQRSRVVQYVEHATRRPSFKAAVINWPMAYSPSPHVKEFSGPIATAKFIVQMLRRRPL